MIEVRWDVPQTEAGLQTLLARLDESRAEGNERAVGYGLLALAWLVKWVRSDNDEPPFVRALTLTNEALAIFRRIGDTRGQLAALQETSIFLSPEEVDRRHDEAMRLTEEIGEEMARGRTLAARARTMGSRDLKAAVRYGREALAIFLRHDAKKPAAAALLGLAIHLENRQEKYAAALESARLYREVGESLHAGRSAVVAVMYGESFLSWPEMAPVVRQGLADALAGADSVSERILYKHLARVAAAEGNPDEAAGFLDRWRALDESDGTPRERWQHDVRIVRTLLAASRASGNLQGVQAFRQELRRLRRRRPRRRS